MTLRDWLGAALHDLAPAAQDRVAAEYQAHVQDAMTGGLTEPEAVATLGDPEQVNRALRRTYATASELDVKPGTGTWRFMLGTLILYATATLIFLAVGIESALGSVTGSLTALALTWLVWRLARNQPIPVRNFLLNQGGAWLMNFSLWLGWEVQAWLGDPPPVQAIQWLLPVLWIVWMVESGRRIQRIQRTLKLGDRA